MRRHRQSECPPSPSPLGATPNYVPLSLGAAQEKEGGRGSVRRPEEERRRGGPQPAAPDSDRDGSMLEHRWHVTVPVATSPPATLKAVCQRHYV